MRLGRQKRRRPWVPLGLVVLALVAVTALRTGGTPKLALESDRPGIGPSTRVTATASEPSRGLAGLTLELIQGDSVTELAREEFEPRPAWSFWGEATDDHTLAVDVGRATPGIREGEAILRLSAERAGTWLRAGAVETLDRPVVVKLTPPRLAVVSTQHYPRQGGSEAVAYVVEEGVARHGVQVGELFFPGQARTDDPSTRFALFAVPFDAPMDVEIRLVAEDELGNRNELPFVDRLFEREKRADRIAVSDAFIERVAPQIEARTPSLAGSGTLIERYLAINRRLRVENRAELGELAENSAGEVLWRGSFMPLPNGQVMARFGDHRTYLYDGQPIDEQDHLGYDMASVRRSEVPAGNAGIVVRARFTGIYGNVVVIDHGAGLLSLYGHLSSISVAEGDRVERGDPIGRTGVTGLAGGDHLHFGMFLHGVATDPVEWLDADWIRNRLGSKLGPTITSS